MMVDYNYPSKQSIDFGALFTFVIFMTMSIACCVWCYCIRMNDKALEHYINSLAEKKGLEVEPFTIKSEPFCQSHLAKENCSIYIPDVGIIL